MAQSALTVTTPNPTPPTNLSSVGLTPPNPQTWNASVMGPPYAPANAPYFDDGWTSPGSAYTTFAAAHALLADSPTAVLQAPEGAGSETVVTATVANPSPAGQLQMFSCGAVLTPGTMPTPNASHASSLSAASTATLTSVTGASNVSGTGTTLLTATGTNFNRSSVIYVNGVAQNTSLVSATSLTCNAVKKPTAGTLPVTVSTNGVQTAAVNWTLT